MTFQPADYPAVASLLAAAPRNVLGPGRPQAEHRAALAALTPESLLAPHRVVDPPMARAALSGLWLRLDFLSESHSISQEINGATGSFWHGIMHRREPDFSNARYWFRRVPTHPVYPALHRVAHDLADAARAGRKADFLLEQANWDAIDFVDLCEKADDSQELETLCEDIQEREWELLFDYCYRSAAGHAS